MLRFALLKSDRFGHYCKIEANDTIEVRFGKRAHNPYLLDAGFAETDIPVPWWAGRRLKLAFG